LHETIEAIETSIFFLKEFTVRDDFCRGRRKFWLRRHDAVVAIQPFLGLIFDIKTDS
jgi:hypothetical protein